MIAVISITFVTQANARDMTPDQKGDVLYKLNILKGYGFGYYLENQLTRSEASAFIVRMRGVENDVLKNKNNYINNTFPDVEKDKWYAPYIGYCVQNGIINGYTDGKFGPEDNISEKAFLKLVLTALGYKYNIDFTWNTIYSKALSAGIINDHNEYANRIDDNADYRRSKVVEALYNALPLTRQDTGRSVILELVRNDAVTRDIALSTAILVDEPVTKIDQANASSSTKVILQLNEEIVNNTMLKVSVYETANISNILTANIESSMGKQVNVITSEQTSLKDYTIELQNVEDIEGNIISSIKFNFSGYRAPEVNADYFRIKKVEPINDKSINVYFTQPININAEVPLYYKIKRDGKDFVNGDFSSLKLNVIPDIDNGITILLKNNYFYTGENYTLAISNELKSNYGMTLLEGQGESIDFIGNGQSSESLRVESIYAEDNKTVVIEFNQAVDPLSVSSTSNFTIVKTDGYPISVIKSVVSPEKGTSGCIVKVGLLQALEEGAMYDLTVKNIFDAYKLEKISETKETIIGAGSIKDMNTFTYAEATDNGTVYLYSNRPLDTAFASNTTLYSVLGVTDGGYSVVPQKIYYNANENPYVVKLYLPSNRLLESGKQYKVRVLSLLKDYLGHSNPAGTDLTFTGVDYAGEKPVIIDARTIDSNAVKVTFSKEISNAGLNVNKTNYVLEYKSENTTKSIQAESVGYINAVTIIIRFESSLDISTSYTLKANIIQDFSEQYIRNSSDGGNSNYVIMGMQ